jgi:hypothetical protein
LSFEKKLNAKTPNSPQTHPLFAKKETKNQNQPQIPTFFWREGAGRAIKISTSEPPKEKG